MQILKRSSLIMVLLLPVPALATHAGGDNRGEIWIDGPADVQPGVGPQLPDVAVDSQGRSINVWYSFLGGSTRHDVFLRRFDAAGNPLADPVMVNTFTDDDQFFPRVAVSEDDSFLVVWQSDEPDSDVNVDRKFVRSQAFDADANPVGPELLVNTLLTGEATDINADVAALKGGGYAIVWRSRKSPGADDKMSIQARLIGANGAALGGQFQANSTLGESEDHPAVTELADGGFLVVWSRPEVHGRRFTDNGTAVGSDFQINTLTAGSEWEPDASLGPDGRVLVVWTDDEDGDDGEIRGRFFNQNMAAQGADFRINTFSAGAQGHVRTAAYGPAGFFVVWESIGSSGDDNDDYSVQGRIVTGGDQFTGSQFQLNVWTDARQRTPGIGGRGDNVAVTWRSSSGNAETTAVIIVGQQWSLCGIFCDGFE